MTVNKKLGKFLTLAAAFLLSLVVVVLMQAYLGDSRFKFSYMIKPSVGGVYNVSVHYTDEKDIDVNMDDGSHAVVKNDVGLPSAVFSTIRFTAIDRPNHKLQRVLLRIQSQAPVPDGSVITVKKLKVNHHRIRELYETFIGQGWTNISKCKTDSCESQINDEYQLQFKDNRAVLYLNSNLSIRSQFAHFANFGTLIVLMISTAIIYLLLRFLLNVKKKESARTSDLILIVAILLTIFIPVTSINVQNNVFEPNENRNLNEYTPLLTGDWHHPINFEWTKRFEQWFNDRFGYRTELVNLSRKITLKYNHLAQFSNTGICQKKNGWCLNTNGWENEVANMTGELNNPVNIDYITKIAQGTNKPVYVLIYPFKTEIYPEKVLFIKHKSKNYLGLSTDAYNKISQINLPNVHAINLLPILLDAKDKYPEKLSYYIDEHHATEFGNKVIMDYLNNNIPEFSKFNKDFDIEAKYPSEILQIASGEFILNKRDFNFLHGQTWGNVFGQANRFKQNKFSKPVQYEFYSLSDAYSHDIEFQLDPKCDANILLHNKAHPDFKVYVIGHSFVETLSKMAATSASDVYRRRVNSACGFQGLHSENVIAEVNNLNPDVILMAFWVGTFTSMH